MHFFRLGWPVAGLATTLIGLTACSDDDSIPDWGSTYPPDSGVVDSDNRSEPSTDANPTEAASRSTEAETSDLESSTLDWSSSAASNTAPASSGTAPSTDPNASSTSTSETFGATTLEDPTSGSTVIDETSSDAGVDGSVTDVSSGDTTELPSDGCGDATALSIFGNYLTQSGDEVWLRNSGNGMTLTRVPAGQPVAARLPQLWEVFRICSVTQTLVVQNEDATYTRVDWLANGGTLFLCIADSSTEALDAALDIAAANGSAPETSGCNAGAWLRLTSGGN